MPTPILKKTDEEKMKENKETETCLKELENLEKCLDEKDECVNFFDTWLKCNESASTEKKSD